MLRTGLSRRLIALVAAYGLALQAMLAAVIVAAPDAALASVICASDHHGNAAGIGDSRAPSAPRHASECGFCPLACGGAAVLPSRVPSVVRVHGVAAPMRPWRGDAPVGRIVSRAGLARAPPV